MSANPIVTVDTNYGDFQLELFPSAAPQTVASFLNYVTSGKYADSIVTRSVSDFVIQGGGITSRSATYLSNAQFQPVAENAPIPLEYDLPNSMGTIAVARSSSPNSGTDQWFINLADNSRNLAPGGVDQYGYAVFGQVIGNGMQVVDKIAALPTHNEGSVQDNNSYVDLANLPLGPNNQLVQIQSMTLDSIDGTVFDDANRNGQLDPGEPGVAGRTVFVNNDGTGVPDASNPSTTTDAGGNFSFSGLGPATYTVEEVVPPGFVATTTSQVITVTAGSTASGIVLGEFAAASIRGTVFDDVNVNGRQDAGEPGLAGITLFIDNDGRGMPDASNPSTITDANGNFSFNGLPPGTYTVRQVPSLGVTTSTPADIVTVVNGQTAAADFGDVLTSTVLPLFVARTVVTNASGSDALFLGVVYAEVLNRQADATGLAYWKQQLSAGVSRSAVIQQIWDSAEHRELEIDQYYLDFLNRPADASGVAYWLGLFPALGETGVVAAIVGSQEYSQMHTSDSDFVDALYHDIALRAADSAGVDYWTGQLAAGATRGEVALSFINSQETTTRIVDELYSVLLHRAPDSAEQQHWASLLEDGTLSLEQAGVAFLSSDEYFDLTS